MIGIFYFLLSPFPVRTVVLSVPVLVPTSLQGAPPGLRPRLLRPDRHQLRRAGGRCLRLRLRPSDLVPSRPSKVLPESPAERQETPAQKDPDLLRLLPRRTVPLRRQTGPRPNYWQGKPRHGFSFFLSWLPFSHDSLNMLPVLVPGHLRVLPGHGLPPYSSDRHPPRESPTVSTPSRRQVVQVTGRAAAALRRSRPHARRRPQPPRRHEESEEFIAQDPGTEDYLRGAVLGRFPDRKYNYYYCISFAHSLCRIC